MKKILLTMAATAMCATAIAAESTVLYERTADTWTDADLAEWVNDNAQYVSQTIDGGLKMTSTNSGWNSTKEMTYAENSTVTLTATIYGGNPPGRSGSYDFIKLGGVEVRLNGQDKKASILIGEEESVLNGFTRGGDYIISISINQETYAATVSVTGGAEGEASGKIAEALPNNVIVGHYKAGKENYEVTETLKDIKITEEASSSEPVGTVTTIVDQTFASGTSLAESADYTWGSEIASMLTDNGLYVTNNDDKGKNYENRDFLTFTNPVGNATHEVGVSYEVYSPKDKGQVNTYYDINYFNAEGDFVFGIQEASGNWAYTANIVTANADGTTSTVALPKGHMAKAGGSVVNLTVKFAEGSAIVTIDGGTYTAYSKSEGIKALKLSVTGERGYDRDMYVKNFMMNTTVVAASTFADYTLNYVCDGEILKSETKSGSVGDAISLTSNDTADFTLDGVKYIYVSNDAEGKTIAADGTTVVTLTYRKAAEYNYTVTNNVNSDVKKGTCVEGESVTLPYCRYILAEDGVLWMKDATNKEYNYTFTPDADNYEVALTYAETETTDAIFYSEAENLEGMTAVTGSNANIRCSNAAGGYADEAVEIYTLKAGTYKVTLGVWGNAGATFTVKAGEAEVLSTETAGYWFETTSEEFTVSEETALTFEGANGTKPLDYVFITGKADEGSAVEAVEAANGENKWYNLQGVEINKPAAKGLYIHNGKKVMVK